MILIIYREDSMIYEYGFGYSGFFITSGSMSKIALNTIYIQKQYWTYFQKKQKHKL